VAANCGKPEVAPARKSLLPAEDSIVVVAVAGGAEGFVVKTEGTDGFFELFAEGMDGAEDVGGGWDFELRGPEKFLVATVGEAGNFSAQQPAWLC